MFTPAGREALRAAVLEHARSDPRITGGAITGSGSVGSLDSWSDVDLAFGVREAAELPATLADFTSFMRTAGEVVDTVDLVREPWVYRVFLLSSTLQVDLAFAPAGAFGARAPTFRLVFGQAADPPPAALPDTRELIGYAWLYALHARSSIARGRRWQAEYMIGAMRDRVLALACLRHGLPASEARGVDALPAEVLQPLEAGLVGGLGIEELARAFGVTSNGLLREIRAIDEGLATRLRPVFERLVETARSR